MKPLRPFNRIEGSLERMIEGAINRVFRPAVQPSEIARKLAREMAGNQLVSVRGAIVPNAFEVTVNSNDFASFGGSETIIAQHLGEWLDDEADRLGFLTLGPIDVSLRPDAGVKPRGVVIESSIREAEAAPTRQAPRFEQTEAYFVHRAPAVQQAWIVEVTAGPLVGIAHWISKQETSVGRALDNDFVLDAADVSRHHALLQVQGSSLRVVDLGSLNGTFLNRRRVHDWSLINPGDLLTFGLVDTLLSYEYR